MPRNPELRHEFQLSDPAGMKKLLPELLQDIHDNPVTGDQLPKYGSIIWLNTTAEFGILPGKNHQEILTYDDVEDKVDTTGFERNIAEDAGRHPLTVSNVP